MSETQSGAQAAAASATETSLLDQIMEETRLRPADDGYDVARQGVSAFIAELLKPSNAGEKLNANAIDIMIADIDRKLSSQIDEVLHADAFQEMESAWRGLKYLVDKTNFRENTKIEILNVSKEDMLADFEDSPEVAKSGLYRHVYTEEYGQFGGQPIATIIGNYDFGPGAQDIKLLQYTASVAAMAHAPFIAAASAEMFGVDKFEDVANLKDLKSVFEGPKYAKWNGFRESEDSRYVGLRGHQAGIARHRIAKEQGAQQQLHNIGGRDEGDAQAQIAGDFQRPHGEAGDPLQGEVPQLPPIPFGGAGGTRRPVIGHRHRGEAHPGE